MSFDVTAKDYLGHDETSPGFWAWHPIGRGTATGGLSVGLWVFSDISGTIGGNFSSGFLYGAISGLVNVATQPVFKKINEKIESPNAKGLNYLLSVAIPWATSAGAIHRMHKATGSPLLHLNPRVAGGAAVANVIFGVANRSLLNESKVKSEE